MRREAAALANARVAAQQHAMAVEEKQELMESPAAQAPTHTTMLRRFVRYMMKKSLRVRSPGQFFRKTLLMPCSKETAHRLLPELKEGSNGKCSFWLRCCGHHDDEDDMCNNLVGVLGARNDNFLRHYWDCFVDPVDKKKKHPCTYVRSNTWPKNEVDAKLPERSKNKHHFKFSWEKKRAKNVLPDGSKTLDSVGVLTVKHSVTTYEEAEPEQSVGDYDDGASDAESVDVANDDVQHLQLEVLELREEVKQLKEKLGVKEQQEEDDDDDEDEDEEPPPPPPKKRKVTAPQVKPSVQRVVIECDQPGHNARCSKCGLSYFTRRGIDPCPDCRPKSMALRMLLQYV